MCTTVPPAKSSAPLAHSQPAPAATFAALSTSVIASGPSQNHTMWAMGRYEKVNQMIMNSSTAENFTRSAKAPTIRAGVIAANVSWKITYTYWGMTTPLLNVAATESGVTPLRKILLNPPKNGPPDV